MVTFLTVLALSFAGPLACWRKQASPYSLFASAFVVYSLYVLAMAITHGWSVSYEHERVTVTKTYWPSWLKMLAYFAVPTMVLLGLERLRVRPKQWIMVGSFFCLNLSMLISIGFSQIYDGFQYPPLWYDTLNQEQIGYMNFAIVVANSLVTIAQWVFLIAITWEMVPRIPSACRMLITTVRSF